jgi:hypothetical protein
MRGLQSSSLFFINQVLQKVNNYAKLCPVLPSLPPSGWAELFYETTGQALRIFPKCHHKDGF